MYSSTALHMYRCTALHMYRCTDIHMCKVYRYTYVQGVQLYICTGVHMYRLLSISELTVISDSTYVCRNFKLIDKCRRGCLDELTVWT